MSELTIDIKVPFSSKRSAEIVYDVLRVDKEPKRSHINKKLFLDNDILIGHFSGMSARMLRVSINNFFENIKLILSTVDFLGPPVSQTYDHY